LDDLIATKQHSDLIGGADEGVNEVKVGTVIDNGVDLSTPAPEAAANPKGKGAKAKATPTPPPPKKGAVTAFFDKYQTALKQSGAQYEKAQPGKKYDLGGGAILTVIAPSEPFFTNEQMKAGGHEINANSIVLRLDYGDFSMLFMGDAEAQTEQRLLGKDVELKANVVKIGRAHV